MTIYQISCSKFTCSFSVEDDVIVDAAPIIRKFIGQPWGNLIRWVNKISGNCYSLVNITPRDEMSNLAWYEDEDEDDDTEWDTLWTQE